MKKIVKAAVPANVDDGMGHGSRQAFAVFTLPGGTGSFCHAHRRHGGHDEKLFATLLFFYDDPHGIYDHWPKDVWAAIDAHQVKPGMSELETRMAIGQKAQRTRKRGRPHGDLRSGREAVDDYLCQEPG